MSTNPNTVKSQDELNEGGRKSDVLVEAISKLETTTKELEKVKLQLEMALTGLKTIRNMEFERYLMANGWVAVDRMRETAKAYIKQVERLNK